MSDLSISPEQSGPAQFLPRTILHRLIAASFVAALIFGIVGFVQYQRAEGEASVRNALYHSVQLFVLHTPHFTRPVPWTLEVGRWLAAMTTGLAVVGVARRMVQEERTLWQLRRLRGHAVVCGLGRKGLVVVQRLRQKGQQVVVIDKAPPLDLASVCRERGALVLTGDATHPDTLAKARLQQADTLVTLCPDDPTNCEIAAQVCHLRRLAKPAARALRCHVHLTDADLRATLQKTLAAQPPPGPVTFHFFDAFDPEARQLLGHELPLDHDGVAAQDPRQVHLMNSGIRTYGPHAGGARRPARPFRQPQPLAYLGH